MDASAASLESRYLKTPDGGVYGPVDAITLCSWAAEARVTPGCLVSVDGIAWQEATAFPELRLHWQTTLPDGTVVGPLNLFALWELLQDGSLPRGLALHNRETGMEVFPDERLLPVALQESRALLETMAGRMAATAARKKDPDADGLRQRLARAERELADNLRLMGESQRLLAAREQQVKSMETRLAESQSRLPKEHREFEARLAQVVLERDAIRSEAAKIPPLEAEVAQLRDNAARVRAERDGAEARWHAERDGLRQEAQERGRAADEAERQRAALAASLDVLQRESQAQIARLTAQVEAMRQAAAVLREDCDARLAEARHAVETAESRSLAERQALEERVASLMKDGAALQSARDDLQRDLVAATSARDAGAQRLRETEERLAEAECGRAAAVRRIGDFEATVRELAGRETAACRELTTAREALAAAREALEQGEQQWRKSAAEAESARNLEKEKLGLEVKDLAERLAESERQRASALAEISRADSVRLERTEQRKREVEQTARLLAESRAEVAGARQALSAERERASANEKRLIAEIKGLQRDVHAMTMAATAVRRVRTEHTAVGPTIDWLTGGTAGAAPANDGETADGKFNGLDLPQQVDLLHHELKLSLDAKDSLRRELDKLRADYAELERRSEAGGQALATQVAQLQSERDSNTSIARQTLEELERRESAARAARKRAEERVRELQGRIDALEAELRESAKAAPVVIQGEWSPPAPRAVEAPPREAPPGNAGTPRPPGASVLNTVEAQLRAELETWHLQEQDKDRKRDKPQNWFRWKKT